MKRGFVIAIEGSNGVGKRTQVELLYKSLNRDGHNTDTFAFPNYDDDSSILVREFLDNKYAPNKNNRISTMIADYQNSLFYAVDRIASFYNHKLWDKINKGTHIIFDRYTYSNIVMKAPMIDDDKERTDYIQWVKDTEFNRCGLPEADIVIYLDVCPEISQNNIQKRNRNIPDKYETLEYQTKLYNRRFNILEKENYCVVKCDDGKRMLSKKSINKKIEDIVYSKLGLKKKAIISKV